MNDPIRTDKEDRYFSENTQVSPKQFKIKLSKTKWIVLILALFIILLLLSFSIFKPESQKQDQQQSLTSLSQDKNDATTNSSSSSEYTTLTPPAISREATKTEQETIVERERIEIPGEVADLLAQKITELNEKNSKGIPVQLESQNSKTDTEYNELPLQKTLEANHFTIQINASSSLENMMEFVKQNKLTNYQIYETRRDQKPWFVLIKGNYPTADDAKKAIKSLSNDLQKNTPWIKSGTTISKEKLLDAR